MRPPEGRLFQERLHHSPFWMTVACCLVNRTTWAQAGPAHVSLVARYVRTEGLAAADPTDLHDTLRPLGLWRQRSLGLVRMAGAWLRRPPRTSGDVLSMPACGKYAADSFAIFVERRYDVEPTDGKLVWYLNKVKGRLT